MRSICELDACTPFDLRSSLPVRATVLRLDDADHALALTIHHTAADGWSLGVVAKELTLLYGAFRSGGAAPLPDVPSYRDYARGQELDQRPEWTPQLVYWGGKLSGATFTELPSGRPRPARRDLRGGTAFVSLPTELSRSLRRLSRKARSSLFMTFSAAITLLVGRWTGDDDVVIGTRLANRPDEFRDAIGLFVNHVAFRTSLAGDPSVLELLGRVRRTALEASRNQSVPIELVLQELGIEQDVRRQPLFQVVVQMLRFGRAPLELDGIEVSPLGHDGHAARSDLVTACIRTGSTGSSKHELSIDLLENGDDIWGRFEYSTQLFDAATVELMIQDLTMLLRSMVTNPAARLSELYPPSLCQSSDLAKDPTLRTDLRALVAEVLQVETAQLDSQSFAELVGDSLMALEVCDRVIERLGVTVDLAVMYGGATVDAAISTLVSQHQEQG